MNNIQVIKIGGNVVDNPLLLEQFIRDFSGLDGPKVLVHGGGVMASQMQKQLGQQPVMIDGRRVTDMDTLKVVTMVYAGWCSKSIVALLQKHGCNAVGLSGADADLIRATRRPPVRKAGQADGETVTIDYGYVGDVDPHMINAGFLYRLTDAGITPVICAITHDGNGSLLNTNADTIASSVAVSLAACRQDPSDGISCGKPENRPEVSLVYCFEKDGVLYDKDDDSSVIPGITPEYYSRLKREGRVAAGMIPKLDNAFNALEHGVKEVVIKHAGNLGNGIGTVLSL